MRNLLFASVAALMFFNVAVYSHGLDGPPFVTFVSDYIASHHERITIVLAGNPHSKMKRDKNTCSTNPDGTVNCTLMFFPYEKIVLNPNTSISVVGGKVFNILRIEETETPTGVASSIHETDLKLYLYNGPFSTSAQLLRYNGTSLVGTYNVKQRFQF